MPRALVTGVAVLVGLLAVPLAHASHEPAPLPEGFTLTLAPDPVPADAPFTVRFTAEDGALAGGKLKVCYSENHAATLCLLPVEMTVAEDGALVGESEGVPPGHEFGVNLTASFADGTVLDYPGNGDEYVFFTASAAERTVPGAGSLVGVLLATVLAFAALGFRRR